MRDFDMPKDARARPVAMPESHAMADSILGSANMIRVIRAGLIEAYLPDWSWMQSECNRWSAYVC